MIPKKTHDKCKHFGYKKCPHINDEIMKLATPDPHEVTIGSPIYWHNFPSHEEVDKICSECDSFTLN